MIVRGPFKRRVLSEDVVAIVVIDPNMSLYQMEEAVADCIAHGYTPTMIRVNDLVMSALCKGIEARFNRPQSSMKRVDKMVFEGQEIAYDLTGGVSHIQCETMEGEVRKYAIVLIEI